MEECMGGRARLILQEHVYGGVQAGSDDFQERTGRIVKKACFEF
jgi:hypothetical protein